MPPGLPDPLPPGTTTLYGVDFTSAPRPAKGIVVAGATAAAPGEPVCVHSLQRLDSFEAFERWLCMPGPWVGAFDLPFGLPRELMADWEWCSPTCADPSAESGWPAIIGRFEALERAPMVDRLRAFCAPRPVGGKFAHRRSDGPAGSSPSMKWVNPPVAQMMHAGAPRLLRAGLHLPAVGVAGDPARVALEGYPGLVARTLIGRASYKTDDRRRQTAERGEQRARIIDALEHGAAEPHRPAPSGLARFTLEDRLVFDPAVRQRCLD
ncbi:MAG TPA: hypothetical protein PK359_08965, partial [Burkholderiaceae bacterium]|nr:hypothetical protein [Burkholderiaceae bacterium]